MGKKKESKERDRERERRTAGEYWRQSGLKSGQIVREQTLDCVCVCVLLRKFITSQPKHCQRPRPFGMTDGKTGHASFTTGTETDRQRSRSSITDTEATPPSLAPTATPPRDSFLELSVKKFSIIIIFFFFFLRWSRVFFVSDSLLLSLSPSARR